MNILMGNLSRVVEIEKQNKAKKKSLGHTRTEKLDY